MAEEKKSDEAVETVEKKEKASQSKNVEKILDAVKKMTVMELAELVKDRVVHVHASDRDKDLAHTVEGEGAVDFPGIFRILKAAGFDGWISLESGGNKGSEGIRQGMEYVKSVWSSI